MGLTSRARDEKAHRLASDAVTWFDREAALCEFQEARLAERFCTLPLKNVGNCKFRRMRTRIRGISVPTRE